MYGAILGDMIGAPYEFDRGNKTKDFPLFCAASQFTDDTVMTIAVAEALLDKYRQGDDALRQALVDSMRKWGRKYPGAGYGASAGSRGGRETDGGPDRRTEPAPRQSPEPAEGPGGAGSGPEGTGRKNRTEKAAGSGTGRGAGKASGNGKDYRRAEQGP